MAVSTVTLIVKAQFKARTEKSREEQLALLIKALEGAGCEVTISEVEDKDIDSHR